LILGYESFEAFGLKEFGLEKSTLHSMANAHHIQTVLEKSNVLDSNKEIPIRSANQLNKLSDAEIPAAYQLANDKAQDDGKKLSAKHVEQAVKELQAQLDEKQKRINWLEISHDAVEKQNDELRNRDEKIIEERIAGERAKLILENQDAIAQAKRDADNAKAEIERLKKEQAKAIKDGVFSEIQKRKTEIDQLEYRCESLQKQTNELKAVRDSLDIEVGAIAIHKESIKNAKEYLTFLSRDFADVFDTATIPPETTNDWQAIKSALMTLTLELDRFTEKNAAIDGAVIESVEV
jgi:chromosome segregation ATPase